jgi:predicted nucleic acid-binding Zn finger protein
MNIRSRRIIAIVKSGDNEYKISADSIDLKNVSCSCPHWVYRLSKSGTHCKHIDALFNQFSIDWLMYLPKNHPVFIELTKEEE